MKQRPWDMLFVPLLAFYFLEPAPQIGAKGISVITRLFGFKPGTVSDSSWSAAAVITTLVLGYVISGIPRLWPEADKKNPYLKIGSILQWLILALLIFVIVIFPTLQEIGLRLDRGPAWHAHDGGVIQTEAAAQMLLEGKNPYVENYHDTPMGDPEMVESERGSWERRGFPENPALYHYVYFPFSLVITAPLMAVAQRTLGWYDSRLLYILLFIIMLFILRRMGHSRTDKRMLVAFLALNPLAVPAFIEGTNDILTLFLIVLAIFGVISQRGRLAIISLALACTTKSFAWLILPFTYAWLAQAKKLGDLVRKPAIMSAGWWYFRWIIIIMVVIIGPFFLWNPAAFHDDVFAFPTGTAEMSYPIKGEGGFGFASYLLAFKLVPSAAAYFPFTIIQIIVCLPLMLFLLKWQGRYNKLGTVIASYAILLFAFSFFARYCHLNHLGYILSLAALAMFIKAPPQED
jgi:hypothetical protein